MSFTLGMAQILVEGGQPEINLARGVARIGEAARLGCQLVVLPECMDLGWAHSSARHMAQSIPGPHSDQLAQAAQENQLFVVAGLVEKAGNDIYNSAILIDPQGTIRLLHRKINVLDIAQDLYSIGEWLGVAETKLGTLGINICADNFDSSLAIGHVLARMGAQVIFAPSAWAMEADHDNQAQPYGELWRRSFSELARLYDVTVVGVSNVGWLDDGPWKGRKAIGCSLAIGTGGEVLVEGPYGEDAEALLIIEVDPKPRIAKGTLIADELEARGYKGP
jgi:predicted amidohydrolase